MKNKLTLVAVVTIIALMETAASGQGHFLFRNLDGGGSVRVDAPVFNSVGLPLEGPQYLAELFGGAESNSLTPLVLIDSGNARLIKPFGIRGYVIPIDGGLLAVPTIPPRGLAWLQLRAWDSRSGATYDEAVLSGMGGYGESPLFYAQSGDPFDQFPEPGRLIGLQSFSLLPVVPEPGTGVLVLLGFGCLAARRWFNRRAHSP